jgi:uncharacterized protein YacL
MGLWALRAFFLLVCSGAGWQASRLTGFDPFLGLLLGIVLFTVVFIMETLFTDKESVASLLAVVFGVTVGMLLAMLAINITTLIVPAPDLADPQASEDFERSTTAMRFMLTAMMCYLCTVIVFRTRDRFRFVIPYVEFKREHKGPKALVLDTSVLIDGRIAAVCRTGFIETPILIPSFVLAELHAIADSADRLKRVRGRRGLDLVNQLRREKDVDVRIYESVEELTGPVDNLLVQVARELDADVCTTDYNLNKVAVAQGVPVLNINDLATALRPSVIPGESLNVQIIRRGEERDQGVGFLDDGTMVVVEEGEQHIGGEVNIEITRVLQKSSGRLIFGKPTGAAITASADGAEKKG